MERWKRGEATIFGNEDAVRNFLIRHPNLVRDVRMFRPSIYEELLREYGPNAAKTILEQALKTALDEVFDAAAKPFGIAGKLYRKYLDIGQEIISSGTLSQMEAEIAARQIERFFVFVEEINQLAKEFREHSPKPYDFGELYETGMYASATELRELVGVYRQQEKRVKEEVLPTLNLFVAEIHASILPYYKRMFNAIRTKFERELGNQENPAVKGMQLGMWRRLRDAFPDFDVLSTERVHLLEQFKASVHALYEYRNSWKNAFSMQERYSVQEYPSDFLVSETIKAYRDMQSSLTSHVGSL